MTVDRKLLVRHLKQDDVQAFEQLFKYYSPRLFNFSKKYLGSNQDCEEIVQIVFEAVWVNRKKIDEDKSFSNYLFAIAKNTILNQLKRITYQKGFAEYVLNQQDEAEFVVENKVAYNELYKILQNILDQMPDRRREVFVLSRFEGLSYREIADKLAITESTVNTQITKALDFIKKKLSVNN